MAAKVIRLTQNVMVEAGVEMAKAKLVRMTHDMSMISAAACKAYEDHEWAAGAEIMRAIAGAIEAMEASERTARDVGHNEERKVVAAADAAVQTG